MATGRPIHRLEPLRFPLPRGQDHAAEYVAGGHGAEVPAIDRPVARVTDALPLLAVPRLIIRYLPSTQVGVQHRI